MHSHIFIYYDKFITFSNDKINNVQKDLDKTPTVISHNLQDIFHRFDEEVLDTSEAVSEDGIKNHSSPT